MTDTLTPLTSGELADLKAKANDVIRLPSSGAAVFAYRGAANPETILRLIAMIERLQSADMKREIENAAFLEGAEAMREAILNRARKEPTRRIMPPEIKAVPLPTRSLIRPPAQKENGE